jgi:hypothetical protein
MLNRLSGARRSVAGRVAALVYLICVLAPSLAFASGNTRINDHCLFDDPVTTAVYEQGPTPHAAQSGQGHHDHMSGSPGATHHHDHATPLAEKSAAPAPSHRQHSALDMQCCNILCVAALPASIAEIATPCTPHAVALPAVGSHLADNLPTRHYRPPIA